MRVSAVRRAYLREVTHVRVLLASTTYVETYLLRRETYLRAAREIRYPGTVAPSDGGGKGSIIAEGEWRQAARKKDSERNAHADAAHARVPAVRAEMFSSGQRGVTLGIQSKLSPPSFSPHPFPLTPSFSPALFSLFYFSVFSLARPTDRSPTHLSIYLLSCPPSPPPPDLFLFFLLFLLAPLFLVEAK